jgi:hypothetical protein
VSYRTPRWLLWGAIAAFLLFGALTLAAILSRAIPLLALWVGVAGMVIGLGGILELVVGRVILEQNGLVIHHWFRTERIRIDDVAAVSLEGGRISLRLKTGQWKRLPEWLGSNRSLGRRLRDRLGVESSP